MGRIRSALQSLYQPNDVAWEKIAPAVQVIRPESQDEKLQSAEEQKSQEHIVDTVGVTADGSANNIFETYGNDSMVDVEGADAWSADSVPCQDDAASIEDSNSEDSRASDVQSDVSDSVNETQETEDSTDEAGEVSSQHASEDEQAEVAADAEHDGSQFDDATRSENEPIAEEISQDVDVEESEDESVDVSASDVEQSHATDNEASEALFEFDDAVVESESELLDDINSSAEADAEVETPSQTDSAAFHFAENDSSGSDEPMDESEQVLNLVQQVLGIAPGIRFEANDDTSDQLQESEDGLLANDSSGLLESEEASTPSEENFEAAIVSDDNSQEMASQLGEDDAALKETPVGEASSLTHDDSEAKFAAVSEFQPVMQTWASVPSEATYDGGSEMRAEAAPPLSNTPIVEENSTRNTEKPVDSPLASELGETTDNSVFFEPANTGSTDIDSSPEIESPPEQENEFYLPPVEESPEVGAYATQAWSPALGALGQLPDRTSATEFERTMAERVLDSDFGTHVQELSHRLSGEIPSTPTTILFLSLEQDDQRAEILAGLAMHICAQRSSPTLLVDADMQQRWISEQFDQSGDGLGEAFEDEKPWYDAVVPTSCENLRFLRSGNFDPSKMDDNQSMRDTVKSLVKDWKATFGLILIDGGKVDGHLVPLLAEMADATYLTVQLGSDERDQLSVVTERLSQFGARLKGCITTAPSEE